jgi:hypothetical protein
MTRNGRPWTSNPQVAGSNPARRAICRCAISSDFPALVCLSRHRFVPVSWGKVSQEPNEDPNGKEALMCANCGCGMPEDQQGDDRNILWSQIVASAEANDISPAEAVRNIQAMADQQG